MQTVTLNPTDQIRAIAYSKRLRLKEYAQKPQARPDIVEKQAAEIDELENISRQIPVWANVWLAIEKAYKNAPKNSRTGLLIHIDCGAGMSDVIAFKHTIEAPDFTPIGGHPKGPK
jgi:hypothetical protein